MIHSSNSKAHLDVEMDLDDVRRDVLGQVSLLIEQFRHSSTISRCLDHMGAVEGCRSFGVDIFLHGQERVCQVGYDSLHEALFDFTCLYIFT